MHLNKDISLKELITVKRDVFSEELCDELINEHRDDKWDQAETLGLLDNYRKCGTLLISHSDVINNNKRRRQLDQIIYKIISPVIQEYAKSFDGHLIYEKDEGYEMLKYEPGGYYKEHTDDPEKIHYDKNGNPEPKSLIKRKLTLIVQLNENFEGGGLSFFGDTYRIEPKKGSVILFPSNYLFPHQALPVTKGVRYSLITWIS